MSIINLFKAACKWVASQFKNKEVATDIATLPEGLTSEHVQHVIDVVNNVKSAVDSPEAVILTALIPTSIDDIIRSRLSNVLPIAVAGLTYVKDALQPGYNPNAALSLALAKVKFSDDQVKDAFYHSLAAQLLVVYSDGKVNWSQAVILVETVLKYLITK